MYQVYIVDDAVLTRKALVMTIPWNQWGCEVVGAADVTFGSPYGYFSTVNFNDNTNEVVTLWLFLFL